MTAVLAVDIGGTKCIFQLTTAEGELIAEQNYASQEFASFDLILSHFLQQSQLNNTAITAACFAVAGPVKGKDAWVTNLPWQLNADLLAEKFKIEHIHLCNDFVAVAYGIDCLSDDELVTLQQGEPDLNEPRAVIGAGTGLGQALMFPQGTHWHIIATEGGHVDFAPTNSLQLLLLEHLQQRFNQVSYERIVSGVGLVSIYEFLLAYKQVDEDPALRQAIINGDPAAAISQFAIEQDDSLANQALDLFVQIYGSQAGNLALNVLSRAGLYIAGGIAAKNIQRFKTGLFIDAFNAKGKMQELMKQIPVYVILQPKVGLIGAKLLAQQMIMKN